MNLDVQARFVVYSFGKAPKVLCFKHAVQAAMRDENVRVEVDNFESEYDLRHTDCEECEKIAEEEVSE